MTLAEFKAGKLLTYKSIVGKKDVYARVVMQDGEQRLVQNWIEGTTMETRNTPADDEMLEVMLALAA